MKTHHYILIGAGIYLAIGLLHYFLQVVPNTAPVNGIPVSHRTTTDDVLSVIGWPLGY